MQFIAFILDVAQRTLLIVFKLTAGLIFGVIEKLISSRAEKPSPPPAHPPTVVQTPPSPPAVYQPPEPVSKPQRPVTVEDVLNNPDREVYFTWASDFIKMHPRSKEFTGFTADMAYIHAHKDGKPFHGPLSMDDAKPGSLPLDIAPPRDDSPFTPGNPIPIPAEDGALWIARPGKFSLAGEIPTRFPAKPEPAPIPMKLLFVPIPDEDGELYVARSGSVVRLKSPEAARPIPPV